ncbi:MAG TPA: TIGR04086 family membrane protein [Actinomycetes bacterium]|jgi:hypothetical protein|nr:TIGR04086 family membrane protein [Actinomycetes bacterium]
MQAYEDARLRQAPWPAPTLIRWGAVFGGGVIGAGFMALLSALWLAIAYQSDVTYFAQTLSWWIGGTAIAALFVAGLLAGWLAGVRGPAAGWLDGLTVWGLTVIAVLSVSVPGALRLFNVTVRLTGATLWAGFWSLLIGGVAATIGGVLGGVLPRRTASAMAGGAAGGVGGAYREPADGPRVDQEPPAREPGRYRGR